MRIGLALALIAATVPLSAMAHDLDDATPYGVVRVDPAALHEQVLAAQLGCRDRAYGKGSQRAAYPAATSTGALAIGVVSGWRGALTETDFTKGQISACMALQGFGPSTASAEDLARFQAVQAAQGRADPYAVIAGFAAAPQRITTMSETPTASGMTRTYTVGRF